MTPRASCLPSGVAVGREGWGREDGPPAVPRENILTCSQCCPDPRCSTTPQRRSAFEGGSEGPASAHRRPIPPPRSFWGKNAPKAALRFPAPPGPSRGHGPASLSISITQPQPRPPPPRGRCGAGLGAGRSGRSPPITAAGCRDGPSGPPMSEALCLGDAASVAGVLPMGGAGARPRAGGGASRPRRAARG